MKSQTVQIWIMILVLGAAGQLQAQTIETARRADIEHLIEYEFKTDDIISFLKDEKRRVEIDQADIDELAKVGADQKLIEWLTAQLPKTAVKKLDVDGVVALWTKNKDERQLLAAVKAADREWLLSATEVLILAREDVPRSVVELMRGRSKIEETKQEAAEKINLDDVLKLTADGVPTAEIVAKVQASPTRFDIDAQRILELKRDGVAMEVLQALYRKRTEAEIPASEASEAETAAEVKPEPTQEIKFTIHRDAGVGYSMLKPENWISTKDLSSTKSITQMVDPEAANGKGLPDLEMSVLLVHPKRKDELSNSRSQLEAISEYFTKSLERQLALDGIKMVAQRPKNTWIANFPALFVETQSRVESTSTSYRGGCYILYANDRIWVLTYSCRLEQSHRWLPILDGCLRSFSLDDSRELVLDAANTDRERAVGVFEVWRRSVRRFDFDSYRKLHDRLVDDVNSRRAFLALASSVNDEGKRLEIDGIDLDQGFIHYNVWGMDGQGRASLQIMRTKTGFLLLPGQP